jgi:hypothetical protein
MVGFTGSHSFVGSQGFSGSQGIPGAGFTGSNGTSFTGSGGFVGSAGTDGNPGYTGSQGLPGQFAALGYTGSSSISFTGSFGFTGSGNAGFIGSRGFLGYTGSGGGSSSGIGLGTRTSASATTSVISNGTTGQMTIAGFKCYSLLKIQTNAASWIRVYTSAAARANDLSRAQGNDPVPGGGVIAEIITSAATVQSITPGAIGWNDESPVNSTVYLSVTNLTGNNQTITVTLTMLQLEA